MDDDEFVRIGKTQVYAEIVRMRDLVSEQMHELNDLRHDLEEMGRRTRALELRFYGILAGLVAAIAILLRVQGAPT